MIWKTTLSLLANFLNLLKTSFEALGGFKTWKPGFRTISALVTILFLSFSPGEAYGQCNSQNVTVTDFFFADENQNPIDPNGGYQIGDPISGFIYATFGGSSKNGFSLYLEYDVYINDVFQEKVSTCLFNGERIPQGSVEQISSFTWNWGDKIELKNYYMDWETNAAPRVCEKLSRNAQCYGAPFSIVVRTPLVANFDFTTSCESYAVDFNNLSTGGYEENYSFSWDFAGLGSSNEINPAFNFGNAG